MNERLLEFDMIMLIRHFHHVHLVRSRQGNQYGSQRTDNFLCLPILLSYLGKQTALMLDAKIEIHQWSKQSMAKKISLESDMIMLTGSFIHVDVRPSELGNRHTGNSYVKHRSPPPHLPLAYARY